MAQTKTVSGNVTTYVITDVEGASVTLVATQSFGAGRTITITTSGNFHVDGQLQLANLLQLISTGLTP